MSIIEVLLLVIGLVAGFIAYRAHADHLTFKQEATADLTKLEGEYKVAVAAVEARVKAIEAKFTTPAPAVVAPAPVVPPVA